MLRGQARLKVKKALKAEIEANQLSRFNSEGRKFLRGLLRSFGTRVVRSREWQ